MTITQVHSVFKERFNRLASDYHQDLSSYQIDRFLNDAMFLILQEGATNELSTKYSNVFSSLTYYDSAISVTNAGNEFTVNIDNLTFPFYRFDRIVAVTNCGDVDVQLETYGRIGDLLSDAFHKPDKKWKRLLATVRQFNNSNDRQLVIYSAPGFTVTNLKLTYIRYPKDVFFGGYDTPDYLHCTANGEADCNQYYSSSDQPQTIDLQENYHTLIIDYAVQEALRSLSLGNEFSLRREKTAQTFIN